MLFFCILFFFTYAILWAGIVTNCPPILKAADLPNTDGLSGWKQRLKERLPVHLWSFSDVTQLDEELQVRVTKMKYRNRHFTMPMSQLLAGITVDPPREPSLYQTSGFFLKLLGESDYRLLQETAHALNGRKLRVGTTCSGSDIGITAVKSMLVKINREFQVSWHQDVVMSNVFSDICIYRYVSI